MLKTMKKVLATVLSLAVCLSILCVPASASDSTAAHDFPYMLFDFEDGIKFTNSKRAAIVEGGMGGSGHALQIVEDESVTDAAYYMKNKWGSDWNATFPAGSTVQISFWVKLANPLTKLNFTLINFSHSGVVGYPSGSGNATSLDWQKITINMPVTDELTWGGTTSLRFGDLGVSYNPVASSEDTTTRTYLIDDFEVKVLDPNYESEDDQIATVDGYRMGFESGAGSVAIMNAGYWNAQAEAVTNGGETLQVVNNPDGRGKVLKVDIGANVAGDGSTLRFTNSTGSGQWSGLNGPGGSLTAGSTITYKFKYYWAQEMDSTNNPGFSIYRADVYDDVDGNGAYTNDGTETKTNTFLDGSEFATSANEWHTAVISSTVTEDIDVLGQPQLRYSPANANSRTWKAATLADGETYGARTLYLDDITMEITSPTDAAEATAPVSSKLIVRNDVAAGNTVYFIHTLTPASTSEAGVTDNSVVRLINVASDGTSAVIGYSSVNAGMLIPEIPADSVKLLFDVIPVSSDGKVGNVAEYPAEKTAFAETAAVADALPYMLCTYEDSVANFTNGTIVEGGSGGSDYALQMTSTYISDAEPYSASYIKDKAGSNIKGTIPAGATLKISFMAKPTTEVSKLDFHLVTYEIGDIANTSVSAPTTDAWHEITLKYKPSEDKTFTYLWLRAYFEGTYLIDDFEAVIIDANAENTDDQIASLDGYRQSFENGASMRLLINNVGYPRPTEDTSVTNGSETLSIVANPDGDGKVLKLEQTDTASGDGTLALTAVTASSGGNYPTYPEATVPAGGTVTYTFRYYFPQEMSSDNTPGFCIYHGTGDGYTSNYLITSANTTANEWHTATLSWTNSTEADALIKHSSFRTCGANSSSTIKVATLAEGETTYGARTIYFDDFKADVIPAEGKATAPVSSNLEVFGTVAAGNNVWFRHTLARASTSAVNAEDTSVVSLVSINASGERNILKTVSANGMTIPEIPADAAKLVFEVVPISADGKVGNTATYAVEGFEPVVPDEPEVITVTTLAQADGKVTITAAEDIINAYIIFVSYDSNHKMVDYDIQYANAEAQTTSEEYAPASDFVTSATTTAMLWADFDDLKPLAAAITY